MNTTVHRFALNNLKHISLKLLMRKFLNWSNFVRLVPEKTKTVGRYSEKPPKSGQSPNKHIRNEGSPRDVSLRLYNKAQEIENHKDEMRKSLMPEYTFTPKLASGTKKWLNSKSKKEFRNNDEEVAVVSGSKVLSFAKLENEFKGLSQSKIPTPGLPLGKTRIVTSRLDRRSDIISNFYESPEKFKSHCKTSSRVF